MKFIQVNNRNLSETIEKLNGLDVAETMIVGFEVTSPEIIQYLDINIDPQHTGSNWYGEKLDAENISASKWLFAKLPTLPHQDITCVVEKLDIDALCALVLWTKSELLSGFENDPVQHETFLELCDRVNAIDTMDCGLGNSGVEWNPKFYQNKLKEGVTAFNVLGAMCSDFRCDIDFKRDAMLKWLVLGELPEKYHQQQLAEFEKETKAVVSQMFGVTCVETTARNVSSLIYSHAPFGIAFNPKFPTPNGKIRKFTVMAFNGKDYLDFAAILKDLNAIDSGWGGNLAAGIIGSPFSGTYLRKEEVCQIVSRHVK